MTRLTQTLAAIAVYLGPVIGANAAVDRPNVVLVMTDDQGYGDLGCHANAIIRTPHLDRLHAQSVRLTNYHVDPTCSPTRSALLTGRYSSRTGVWHTIAGRSIIRRDEVMLAELFAAAGYRTGIFGKWHLGDNYPSRPQDRGFQEVVVHGGGGVTQTPDYWGNTYFDDTYWHNGRPTKYRGYCTDVFFSEALRFIQENRDRPFFCYLPTNAPHGPFNVAEEYVRPYVEQGVVQPMANFYGMITNIDENMGRLLKRLEQWGLADNTLLIFTTDNGTAAGVLRPAQTRASAGSWPGFNDGMRGQKGSQYEGGHRVPCFWRWPARLPAGVDVKTLTAHVDMLPTLAEFCGLPLPPGVALDGASLVPLLTGRGGLPARTMFVHSQRVEHPQKWKTSAVMTQRWRLVDGKELYDLDDDPAQQRDVAGQQPAVVALLREAYEGWWDSISSRFDEYCEIVLGADAENPALLTCHDWHGETVPYNQEMIRRAPMANGFWAVEIARAGRYEFTLWQQPPIAAHPLDAASASLQVGGVSQAAAVPSGATSVTFTVPLPSGRTRLETSLTDASGRSRGAFFVEVRRLD